jgi:phage terminase large subunit
MIGSKEEVRVVKYTELFEITKNSMAKVLVHVGGAGSSKSHSIAQYIIYMLVTMKNKHIAVMRKTFPALRLTAMALILDLLKEYGIYDEKYHNKTANTYTYGSNTIYWMSLDDPEKVKSANLSFIWLEEGNEFDYEDFMILKLRLRAPTPDNEPNRMVISLNPSDAYGWIATKLCSVKQGVQ